MSFVVAALLVGAVTTSTAVPPTARFAVVIGNNYALPGSGYDTLSFADDDAMRFAQFFEDTGVKTFLLAAPDADTAERFGALADRAQRPTRAVLDRTLAKLEAELEAAEGMSREVYFVFSGHGSMSASQAYLHLFDQPFTRTDLFEQILKRLPAERMHVIIDSCHSYFLVNSRGKRVAVAQDEDNLARYPSIGFMLSTSDRREVQEWAGYRAGVFSYQILGALRGAADVDLDGTVTYAEAHAYVVAANLAVENPDARISPYIRRPATRGTLLVDHRSVPLYAKARVRGDVSGHFHLTDGVRGRLLDANKPPGSELLLVVPKHAGLLLHKGEQAYGLVRNGVDAGAFRAGVPQDMRLASASKGSVSDEFRTRLFQVPLSVDFVRGVEAGSPQVTSVSMTASRAVAWHQDPWTLGLLGTGTAFAVTGVVSTVLFTGAHAQAEVRPVTLESEEARARATRYRGLMIAGYTAGTAFLVGGLIRALVTNQPASASELSIGPAQFGTGLAVLGHF